MDGLIHVVHKLSLDPLGFIETDRLGPFNSREHAEAYAESHPGTFAGAEWAQQEGVPFHHFTVKGQETSVVSANFHTFEMVLGAIEDVDPTATSVTVRALPSKQTLGHYRRSVPGADWGPFYHEEFGW